MHKLRENERLAPSMGDDITDDLLDNLLSAKEKIEQRKEEGFTVALVHLSGDLTHSSHIQYMNTIKAKLEDKYGRRTKLVVGVEADSRTMQRKNKENVFGEKERVYLFNNMKPVDYAFVEFEGVTGDMENEQRPAGIVQYLEPSVMVSHQEHISTFEDYLGTFRRMKASTGGQVMVINYGDEGKYLNEPSARDMFGRSTTNTIKKILSLFKGNAKYDNPSNRKDI